MSEGSFFYKKIFLFRDMELRGFIFSPGLDEKSWAIEAEVSMAVKNAGIL